MEEDSFSADPVESNSPTPEWINKQISREGCQHQAETYPQNTNQNLQTQSQTNPILDLNKPPAETTIISHPTYQRKQAENQRAKITYHHYTTTYPPYPEVWRNRANLKRTEIEMILQINEDVSCTPGQNPSIPCITHIQDSLYHKDNKNDPVETSIYSVGTPHDSPQTNTTVKLLEYTTGLSPCMSKRRRRWDKRRPKLWRRLE